ncbi:VOC family protein [Gracilimonas sp. Q87]|uniref:VOC family protein n=1 Tax=Gracilimonas sp. Q87 TaxID=3384766 RepID=UPI0039841ADA
MEFPSVDLEATKDFFKKAFGWKFNDYGSEYCDFANEGINGGFYKSKKVSNSDSGGALIIFYSKYLKTTQNKIQEFAGKIVEEPGKTL